LLRSHQARKKSIERNRNFHIHFGLLYQQIAMSDKIENITLTFSCREKWDQFEVVPGGRLCAGCQHIVRDFRDCSMVELQEALKDGQRVCGRFLKEQMSATFLKAAAVALTVTSVVACETETPKPIAEEDLQFQLSSEEFMGDTLIIDSKFDGFMGLVFTPIDSVR
jgi:hypothetical protein